MKQTSLFYRSAILLGISLVPLAAASIVWDNSNATGAWSTAENWDTNTEPTAADDVTFPLGLAGTITTTTTENALSLTFDDAYTLSGGILALASGNSINVADGVTASINNALTITGGLSKTGTGTLVLGSSNTNAGGTVISAGKIRAANAGALGAAGTVTTVNSATTLEVANGITLDRPVTLMNGGTVAGIGAAANNGKITIDAAATAVTFATDSSTDVYSVGNGANDITGGSGSTVISLSGTGTVRLGGASDFDGSWAIPTGRLELGAAAALGDQATSSLTLSGGTLSARLATATTFTGPATNLIVTADSGLLSDRNSVSAGVTHILGTLSMGAQTLTVAPGSSATSGTAGITLANVTFTGNPVLAINDSGATNGKLTTGSILSGIARSIIKSGAGDLAVTGGSTDLPVGSSFTATGGGTIELLFPDLGTGSPIAITAAQNPFGSSTISVTDGALRLLANGSNSSALQTFQLPSAITLGGTIMLDPDERSGSNSNKTFELSGLTLAPGTELSMSGDNLYGVLLTGPLVLQGNSTLKGIDTASKDGLLTLNGGISGGLSTVLSIGGGTSPINLTINAAGTYGGGTQMSGGNVTLTTANALGTGALTMAGGTLSVNADAALNGTVNLNGGTLIANGATVLATNPVIVNGGKLDLRNNGSASVVIPSLSISGTSEMNFARVTTSPATVLTIPTVNVSGTTTVTLTNGSSTTPLFSEIDLSGDLTLNHAGTTRVLSVIEDGSSRKLIKTGAGTLELEGASTHSGGTEVLAGILYVEQSDALGSGSLTIGADAGAVAATARFVENLVVPNDIVIRSGNSGTMTLDAEGGNLAWNGDVDLQKSLTVDNGGAAAETASLNGRITGVGNLIKIGAGELALTDPLNSFGSGSADSLTASAGAIVVSTDGALGDSSNGITVAGTTGALKIVGSFSTSRTLTLTGTSTGAVSGVDVTTGNQLTVNAPLAGSGVLRKVGDGTLTIAPGVDSSGRGSAVTNLTGGTLRVQGPGNLSANGNITLNTAGTLEFLRDTNTVFPHLIAADGSVGATIHVDRAPGGAAINGRHTLNNLTMNTGGLTVTGANGYGLSFGAASTLGSSALINNASAKLILSSLTGDSVGGNVIMTFGGTGDIEITGAMGSPVSNYGITKTGPGTLLFGSGVTEFARATVVNDGTLDLNNLTYNSNALTLGGATSALGAQLVTGAAGSLALGGTLTYSSSFAPPGALISGNLDLGNASRSFVIGDSSNAPVDLTIDGPITGSAGAEIAKSGTGTLRLTGAGNTQPGLVTVTAGTLEFAKSSGDAIGTGGLSLANNGTIVGLGSSEQIHNSAAVAIGTSAFLELNNFTETTGPITMTQTTPQQYNAIKTGATGTLVLAGNLVLNNNTNTLATTSERNILITGSGTKSVATTTGTLDLGGALRSIHVATNGPSTNANATIETRIINGGIIKTGPRTLFLNHPDNTFAGGLQVAEGTVRPAGAGSLGTGPVTFTNAPGTPAGIDFGTLSGNISNPINTGTGDFTLTYAAPAPNVLTLSGGINLQQDITIDVVNGSVENGFPTEVKRAVVDVSGPINDAASAFGLTKVGDGMLKLAAGNTFGGGTLVQRGILSVAADNSLGDSSAPLTLDGGCLATSNSFALTRGLVIGANGGSLRADLGRTMEIAGALNWGSATTGTDGSGRIVISGSTTGTGNLRVGEAIAFAPGTIGDQLTWNVEVCLLGPAALPTGNLSIGGFGVLELGNGNFTRPLGTGPGEVQLPTNSAGGWAAVGANRTVNIGGAGAPLVWGQASPPFLFFDGPGSGDIGQLVLGSFTATHTVEFQNDLVFPVGASFLTIRQVTCHDGAAAVDGRITGDAIHDDPVKTGVFSVTGDGTLEMAGDLLGRFGVNQNGQGKTILSGNNTGLTNDIAVFEGTLVLANDASMGSPGSIVVFPGTFHSELDASALSGPLTLGEPGQINVAGLITGDVQVNGWLSGNGEITGDVTVPLDSSLEPSFNGTLEIGGDLTLASGGWIYFEIYGTLPESDHNRLRITGEVNLSGELYVYGSDSLAVGDEVIVLLNDGSDPINGTFAGMPEGASISIAPGLAVQITYQANGDGGAVGNDIGFTVIEDAFSSDLWLTGSAPIIVAPGAEIVIPLTIQSFGPSSVDGAELQVSLPANAVFVSSDPAGTVDNDILTIPLPLLLPLDVVGVELRFTAPAAPSSVTVTADLTGFSDPYPWDNSYTGVTAVLPGGTFELETFASNLGAGTVTLGINALEGVTYLLQSSTTLEPNEWSNDLYFIGDGIYTTISPTIDKPKEFFRIGIVPYGSFGGGVGE